VNPLETYFRGLRDIRSTGAPTPETSYYGTLANLVNEIGKKLKPRVRCVINLANRGAGMPDGGLFTASQFQRASDAIPLQGQPPERGAIEIKSPGEAIEITSASSQVARYLKAYGLILVTNYRDFVLIGKDAEGQAILLERYCLAESEADFWRLTRQPARVVQAHGERFVEYLKRVMLHSAPLSTPADVAWFLASYARDSRARIEEVELPALAAIRGALETALGVTFKDRQGEHFFRSTLVQTLFYGIFSAWVLWHRQKPTRRDKFDWRQAAWSLHVPMIRALFEQVAAPSKLEPLGLVEPLDWAAGVLNRVDRFTFFVHFEEEYAVQYFYEPFLEAFDPELRRRLGVWYTPPEIVRYMVARVDTVLREELGLADGLADKNVYVLDPCCGTGAFLVEALRRIAATLQAKGEDALLAADLKKIIRERLFGFEILPAPFVVAHLQLGLLLQHLGVPLSEKRHERAGVYLTNALTGWGKSERSPGVTQLELVFPELAEERDAANEVKRDRPILVVLGNPPYSGYAGVALDEERDLSTAYRSTRRAPAPQGQGLNDLYARFYRMAERKIIEGTGKGVVCFISNYSWLDSLSFPGMRERYLEVFDRIWIDNLHGDRIISEYAPDGHPSETIFAVRGKSPGITLGTAIALLVCRKAKQPEHQAQVLYRDFDDSRAADRRATLLRSLTDGGKERPYLAISPSLELGFPFKPRTATTAYLAWPRFPEIFPVSFPGVKTSRDDFVVDIDRDRLEKRMRQYFDPKISHEEMRRICPRAMESTNRFRAEAVRDKLRSRGFLPLNIVRYYFRPFDVRWIYWEPETKLLDERRAEYRPHVFDGNFWLSTGQRSRKEAFYQPLFCRLLADHHIVESNVGMFPLFLRAASLFESNGVKPEPNLSPLAVAFLSQAGSSAADLFFHALAVLQAPHYLAEHEGALRQDWPRVPLPASSGTLAASAALGRQVADLLDPEAEAPGVTAGDLFPELRSLGNFALVPGHRLEPERDLTVTAGWGYKGKGGAIMPGQGRLLDRRYSIEERNEFVEGAAGLSPSPERNIELLGVKTFDVFLNEAAFWRNVPQKVWEYTLGGYPVLKKWLSYRELSQLGRPLSLDEAREVTAIVRRIAALLLLQPALNENYRKVKAENS
jgi:hypothetical protein